MNKLGKQNGFDDGKIVIYDVLSDIIYSLSNSKYKDMFAVKGAYALAAALINQKLDPLVRSTIDIDMWFFNKGLWKEFINECGEVLSNNSRLKLNYTMVEAKQTTDRWRSGYILLKALSVNGDEFEVKIDMKIGVIPLENQITLPSFDVAFNAVSFENMLADKLFNMTFWIIAKRPRDFYDVYTLAHLKNYRLNEIEIAWESAKKYFNADKSIYSFNPDSFKELEQEITALLEREQLPVSFRELYSRVWRFSFPIFEYLIYGKENKYWDVKGWCWLGMD